MLQEECKASDNVPARGGSAGDGVVAYGGAGSTGDELAVLGLDGAGGGQAGQENGDAGGDGCELHFEGLNVVLCF